MNRTKRATKQSVKQITFTHKYQTYSQDEFTIAWVFQFTSESTNIAVYRHPMDIMAAANTQVQQGLSSQEFFRIQSRHTQPTIVRQYRLQKKDSMEYSSQTQFHKQKAMLTIQQEVVPKSELIMKTMAKKRHWNLAPYTLICLYNQQMQRATKMPLIVIQKALLYKDALTTSSRSCWGTPVGRTAIPSSRRSLSCFAFYQLLYWCTNFLMPAHHSLIKMLIIVNR